MNGESFSDSNLIIEKLKEKFSVDIDRDLTREQRAMTHAATGMIENFTAQTGFHYRYGLHMQVCLIIFNLNNFCIRISPSEIISGN